MNYSIPPAIRLPQDAADRRWAVILAGGDGRRLLPLTRTLAGDDRPKQFCNLFGEGTLWEQTAERAAAVALPEHTFSVVTQSHARFYSRRPPTALLIQPCNKGTAPAIAYSLMCLHRLDPSGVAAFFPSDHHFAESCAFTNYVKQALACAESFPDRVFLLGMAATRPETGYGWIEPGALLAGGKYGPAFGVRRFWEKPPLSAAVQLLRRGWLWNSFVMAGKVSAFLNLMQQAIPRLYDSFQAMDPAVFIPALLTKDRERALSDLYDKLPCSSFSSDVLVACPEKIGVLCSSSVEWTDVGDVRRALSVMNRKEGPSSLPVMPAPGVPVALGLDPVLETEI